MGGTGFGAESCSDGWAMLNKSLMQPSADVWGCVPSLTVVGVMVTSFKRTYTSIPWLPGLLISVPDTVAGHCRPTPLQETPGHSQASAAQFVVGSLFLSPGSWCAQVLFVPSKSLSPQSCGSSGSSMGRVNGNHLQDGLYHTQVCCTQSPCPCSRPLLTQTSTGDIRTQFWLSLCGVPRSWCALDLF